MGEGSTKNILVSERIVPPGDHLALPPAEEDAPADRREVGVGPWPGGEASWPDDPRYDREILA